MKEREISLIDLFVEILLHWRMFIILTFGGIILLGSLGYIRLHNEKKNSQVQTETTPSEPESQFTVEEMQNVAYVVAYETAYNAKKTYFEESPLMNIDPNHINKAEATIAVITEDRQKSCDIKKIYEDIIQSEELCTEVAKKAGIETAYINEILFLESINIPQDTITFKVVIISNSKIQCQNILELVIAFLGKKQPEIENVLGCHELAVVNKSFGITADSNIITTKQTVLTEIANMKNTISSAKDNLSDAEQQYYSILTGTTKNNPTVIPKINIKHIFLGAFIFPFLYMLILFITYILNTKIRITDNLQELYEIPQLGMIPIKKNTKKLFGFIDGWILSLQNYGKRCFTFEESLGLATIATKISIEKEMFQEIYLIGCGLKERSLDICEEIKSRLSKDNIQVTILNNVLYDAQMMSKLGNAKGAVLIETAGSTLYNEIFDELEFLKRQGIKVLGGILVE